MRHTIQNFGSHRLVCVLSIISNPDSTFGPHRNDPIERIVHRQNRRQAILQELDHGQVAKFVMHTITKDTKKYDPISYLEKQGIIIHKGNTH